MTLRIIEDNLQGDAIRALLTWHFENMQETSPPGHSFALDLRGLTKPEVTLWSVWEGPELAGCGALRILSEHQGEIKSMRTAPGHLRKGVGTAILTHIIEQSRARGLRRLSLETGTGPEFEPAIRLYKAHHFKEGEAFGDYEKSAFNCFLHRDLCPSPD